METVAAQTSYFDLQQVQQKQEKKRRKKASRACSHCQKAHLTCNDSRPCQRCVKRGLENTCTDGMRKIAKYLQQDDSLGGQQLRMTPPQVNDYGFVSDATNLEYDMLSSTIQMDGNQQQRQSEYNTNWYQQEEQQIHMILHTTSGGGGSDNTTAKAIKSTRKKIRTPQQIYAQVQKPYNYASSYRYLIQYVKQHMGKSELIRISRALVLFRPSYMSLVSALTEQDLIYMEKCVQRILLEYEKLMSFSGTPTVVWRRTGEIMLVGKEFLRLTRWTKQALLGRKCIYELMDHGSAIEYWEKFSQHAFDNAESGVTMSVILKSSPNHHDRPVPCTFCFTLKRDIFDLPCVVVGNFLPILDAAVNAN